MVHAVAEADAGEQLARACRRPVVAPKLERHLNVLEGRERRDQLKALEHEPNFLATKPRALVFAHRREIGIVEQHATSCRRIESGQASV